MTAGLVALAVVEFELEGARGGDAGLAGLAGVRVVPVGALTVAVREVASAPRVEPAALREQDALVRALAARWEAILPFRFGTVVADEGGLGAALAGAEATLREGLVRVRGKEQWTLRLFGGADAKLKELAPRALEGDIPLAGPPSPAIPPRALEGDIPLAGPRGPTISPEPAPGAGARYLAERARIRAGAPIPGLDDLRRTLGTLVSDERLERHESPGLLASLYHLVLRARADDYRAALARVAPALGVRVSGPFPPYAFAPPVLA